MQWYYCLIPRAQKSVISSDRSPSRNQHPHVNHSIGPEFLPLPPSAQRGLGIHLRIKQSPTTTWKYSLFTALCNRELGKNHLKRNRANDPEEYIRSGNSRWGWEKVGGAEVKVKWHCQKKSPCPATSFLHCLGGVSSELRLLEACPFVLQKG